MATGSVRILCVVLALVLACCAQRDGEARDGPSAQAGARLAQPAQAQARLATGATVRWTVALPQEPPPLLAGRLAGRALVARAGDGTLLRFDVDSLSQTATGTEAVVCLGSGPEGEVLAGLAGGRIVRVDPTTLGFAELAKVAGDLVFVGRDSRGLVAATMHSEPLRPGRQRRYREDETVFVVHDLAAQATHRFVPEFAIGQHGPPSAVLLDRQRRLWLGFDCGEWGGWLGHVDLRSGAASGEEAPHGVFGLIETRAGRILCFGGVEHRFCASYVSAVEDGKLLALHTSEFSRRHDDGPVDPPAGPIAHVVEDPVAGGFLVFTQWTLYRVDAGFQKWTRWGQLGLGTPWGRPDSIGSYPSITSMQVRSLDPLDLLATTRLDGVWRLRAGPDGLRAERSFVRKPRTLAVQREDVVLLADEPASAWRRAGPVWRSVLPLPAQPALERRVLAMGGGGLLVVERRDEDADLDLWRHRGTAVDRLPSVRGQCDSVFSTPDGQLWLADPQPTAATHRLARLVDGAWQTVGAPEVCPGPLDPVASAGPPWLLHSPRDARLYTLAAGDRPTAWSILAAPPGGTDLREVSDVRPWRTGQLLVVDAWRGVGLLEPRSGAFSAPGFACPEGPLHLACPDAQDRVWLAGQGLWVADGPVLHDLRAIAALGSEPMVALQPDPAPGAGIVALRADGAVLWLALDR